MAAGKRTASRWLVALSFAPGGLGADPRVRRRIAAAIDRADLVAAGEHGLADPSTGWAAPTVKIWPQGTPPADGGAPITLERPLTIAAGRSGHVSPALAERIAAQLTQAGLVARVVVSTGTRPAAGARSAAADLRIEITHGVPYDPWSTLVSRFGPRVRERTAESERGGILDAALAALVEKAMGTGTRTDARRSTRRSRPTSTGRLRSFRSTRRAGSASCARGSRATRKSHRPRLRHLAGNRSSPGLLGTLRAAYSMSTVPPAQGEAGRAEETMRKDLAGPIPDPASRTGTSQSAAVTGTSRSLTSWSRVVTGLAVATCLTSFAVVTVMEWVGRTRSHAWVQELALLVVDPLPRGWELARTDPLVFGLVVREVLRGEPAIDTAREDLTTRLHALQAAFGQIGREGSLDDGKDPLRLCRVRVLPAPGSRDEPALREHPTVADLERPLPLEFAYPPFEVGELAEVGNFISRDVPMALASVESAFDGEQVTWWCSFEFPERDQELIRSRLSSLRLPGNVFTGAERPGELRVGKREPKLERDLPCAAASWCAALRTMVRLASDPGANPIWRMAPPSTDSRPRDAAPPADEEKAMRAAVRAAYPEIRSGSGERLEVRPPSASMPSGLWEQIRQRTADGPQIGPDPELRATRSLLLPVITIPLALALLLGISLFGMARRVADHHDRSESSPPRPWCPIRLLAFGFASLALAILTDRGRIDLPDWASATLAGAAVGLVVLCAHGNGRLQRAFD